MRICVDASIGAKWFVPERGQQEALSLLDPYAKDAADLVVPDLFLIEVTNAFRHHLLQGNLTPSEMADAIDNLLELRVSVVPASAIIKSAAELAQCHSLTIWDAAYLAVAEREECDFWTADRDFMEAEAALGYVHILTWD